MVSAIGEGTTLFHDTRKQRLHRAKHRPSFLRPLRQHWLSSIQNSGRACSIDFFFSSFIHDDVASASQGCLLSRQGLGWGRAKGTWFGACFQNIKRTFISLTHVMDLHHGIPKERAELCIADAWTGSPFRLHLNICNYGLYLIGEEKNYKTETS